MAYLLRLGKPTLETCGWTGQTIYKPLGSAFRNSICGWGGVVAEELADNFWESPSADQIWDSFDLLGEFSQTDRSHIKQHRNPYRTLERTIHIIAANRDRVKAIAEALLREGHAGAERIE